MMRENRARFLSACRYRSNTMAMPARTVPAHVGHLDTVRAQCHKTLARHLGQLLQFRAK